MEGIWPESRTWLAIPRAEGSSSGRAVTSLRRTTPYRTSQLRSEVKAQWLGSFAIRRCLTELRCLKKTAAFRATRQARLDRCNSRRGVRRTGIARSLDHPVLAETCRFSRDASSSCSPGHRASGPCAPPFSAEGGRTATVPPRTGRSWDTPRCRVPVKDDGRQRDGWPVARRALVAWQESPTPRCARLPQAARNARPPPRTGRDRPWRQWSPRSRRRTVPQCRRAPGQPDDRARSSGLFPAISDGSPAPRTRRSTGTSSSICWSSRPAAGMDRPPEGRTLSQGVHSGACGEIIQRLPATMQHHDERHRGAGLRSDFRLAGM